MASSQKKSRYWLFFWIYLSLVIVSEFFVTRYSYFGSKGVDGYHGFFVSLGVFASLLCILLAILIGMICRVKESYYD